MGGGGAEGVEVILVMPKKVHFSGDNPFLRSCPYKSLLHFVVCFIVWTGEYHTLVVVSLLTQPQMYNIFSVLCLLYPQLFKMEHLNRAMK